MYPVPMPLPHKADYETQAGVQRGERLSDWRATDKRLARGWQETGERMGGEPRLARGGEWLVNGWRVASEQLASG